MMTPQPNYEYQDWGTLPLDSLTYVTRQADEDFYQALKAGKFCYVLNSRQMGKSSLRVRAMQRLESEGIVCLAIDMSINTDVSQEQWYAVLIDSLVSQLSLPDNFNLDNWWSSYNSLSPMQRFSRFTEEILLSSNSENIVVFIDEIDSIISLDFKVDDFFAFIRYCYNQRADKPKYKRLTFALLGVATPSDLIKDKTRTPFNIGQAIELNGFQIHEVSPLAQGLEGKVDNSQEILRQILNWTGGQPYLTHRLCKLVDESQLYIVAGEEAKTIKQLVQINVIDDWEYQDKQVHLQTICNRILGSKSAVRLLGLYQNILKYKEVTPDDSPEEMELRLSGLVVEQQSKLKVYNRIYQVIFDQTWVGKELAKLRPYAEAINAWLASERIDNSRLLQGKALEDAQQWADKDNKILSNDDYQFLRASHAQAWKLMSFKFKNGEAASNVCDLIALCDRCPEEAEVYLFTNYFEGWLVNHLGRTDLAIISKKLTIEYESERRKGLEMFVRELCKSVEIEPYPKIFTQPDKLDFGSIPVGYQNTVSLEVGNNGRGFAWGDIKLEGDIPGITITNTSFNFLTTKTIDIQLDTLYTPPGYYQGSIVLNLINIDNPWIIQINYQVTNLRLYIKPTQLNLGIIKNDIIVDLNNVIEISCEPVKARIKGFASTQLGYFILIPTQFETSSFDLSIKIDTRLILPGKYEDKIIISTNIGEYYIPIYFAKPTRWKSTIAVSIFFAIGVGSSLSFIRFISSLLLKDKVSEITNFCYLISNPKNFLLSSVLNILPYLAMTMFIALIVSIVLRSKGENISVRFIKLSNDFVIHLVIISTLTLLTFGFLYNFLSLTGLAAFVIIDLLASPLKFININTPPSIGWFIVGLVTGALTEIVPALNRNKKDKFLLWAFIVAVALAILMVGYSIIDFGCPLGQVQ